MTTPRPFDPPVFAIILAVTGVMMLALYFGSLEGARNFGDQIVGRDFITFYLGGELIREGRLAVLFDEAAFHATIRDWLGPDYPPHNWAYPPLFFPIVELMAGLPYLVAYAVWVTGTCLLLV